MFCFFQISPILFNSHVIEGELLKTVKKNIVTNLYAI